MKYCIQRIFFVIKNPAILTGFLYVIFLFVLIFEQT